VHCSSVYQQPQVTVCTVSFLSLLLLMCQNSRICTA